MATPLNESFLPNQIVQKSENGFIDQSSKRLKMKYSTRNRPKLIYFTPLPDVDSDWPETDAAHDQADRLPRRLFVSVVDLFCYAFAIVTFLTDVLSDLVVAYYHWANDRVWPAGLVLTFVAVPSLLLNAVAFAWWLDDSRFRGLRSKVVCSSQFVLRAVASLLQVGPAVWYAEAIYFGCRFRRSSNPIEKRESYLRMLEADRDATLLRTFEAFLEAAPQLLVQGYLTGYAIWDYYDNGGDIRPIYLQLTSITLSLLSIAWSLTVQHRCLRLARQDKRNMSLCGSFMQFLWRLFTITGRCLALVLFIMAFNYWGAVVLLIHYLVSIGMIYTLQKVDIGGSAFVELGVILIASVVQLFTPLNLAEGPTRWRYLAAYLFEFSENVLMLALCWQCHSFEFPFIFHVCLASVVAFLVGIMFMLCYYSICHPNECARAANSNLCDNADHSDSASSPEVTAL